MILCPKCQQPLGKNHRCFLVPQDVQAKREMAALDGLLKRMGNAITEQHNQINLLWSYARGLERRLDQLTKKVQGI